MNELIRELYRKADQQALEEYWRRTEGKTLDETWDDIFDRILAKVFVEECANWMVHARNEDGDTISDGFYWSLKLKEHFGIK